MQRTSFFFADFVIGSDWSFQLAVSNNSPTDSLDGFMGIAVDVNHEAAVTWKEALESGTTQRFSIPPGGTRIYNEWPNVGPGEMIRGGVIILQLSDFPDFQSDTQMLSAVLTYGNDQTGIELAVPPLRVEDLTPPFFNDEVAYSIFIEETADVTTGVALWKTPGNEVCMWLTGLDGTLFQNPEGYDTICYSPLYGDDFSHAAVLLPEWFPGWDFSGGFQGQLVVSVQDNTFGLKGNDGLVVPMGLRANRHSGLMSAMPVVPVAVGRAFEQTRNSENPQPSLSRLLKHFRAMGY